MGGEGDTWFTRSELELNDPLRDPEEVDPLAGDSFLDEDEDRALYGDFMNGAVGGSSGMSWM